MLIIETNKLRGHCEIVEFADDEPYCVRNQHAFVAERNALTSGEFIINNGRTTFYIYKYGFNYKNTLRVSDRQESAIRF